MKALLGRPRRRWLFAPVTDGPGGNAMILRTPNPGFRGAAPLRAFVDFLESIG